MLTRSGAIVAMVGVLATAWFMPLVPVLPEPQLDSAWRLGLALGCEKGLVHGIDLIFTFGPLGCLVTWQYWPATYLPALAFWFMVAATSVWLVVEAGTDRAERLRQIAALALLGFSTDSALLALPLAFVLHGWRTGRMSAAAWTACLALGPLALTKFTLLPLATVALITGLLVRTLSPVSVLVGFALAVGSAAIALTMASQPWQAFGAYLVQSVEVARHYPDAMHWPASFGPVDGTHAVAVAALLLGAASAAVLILAHAARRTDVSQLARLAFAAFLLAAIMLVVRHGTVRGDSAHLFPASIGLAGMLLLFRPPSQRLQSATSLAATLMILLATLIQDEASVNIAGGSMVDRVRLSVVGVSRLLTAVDPRADLDRALSRSAAQLRAQVGTALPPRGTIDVISYDQFLLLATDPARWSPRPILQSYSAYTPTLTRLNARFLNSDSAPESLIVAAQTIDERLVTMDDAAIWEVLRSRYLISGRLGTGHLVLSRRDAGRLARAAPVQAVVEADDWVALPQVGRADLYASVRLAPTWWDRLRTALWKPPARFIEVRMASGAVLRFRLLTAAAEGGFLLSPLVRDTDSLARWLEGLENGAEPRPSALRVVDGHGTPVFAAFSFGAYPYSLE